jgi:hypothetical protein
LFKDDEIKEDLHDTTKKRSTLTLRQKRKIREALESLERGDDLARYISTLQAIGLPAESLRRCVELWHEKQGKAL